MGQFYAILCCAALLLAGCERSGPTVHFSVPDGFHGVFKVSVDPQRGAKPTKTNNVWVIVVPTNALSLIDDSKYFARWHSETASHYNGQSVSVSLATSNAVALRSLFADSEGNFYWLVGTKREQDIAHFSSVHELPLGRPLTDEDLPEYAKGR